MEIKLKKIFIKIKKIIKKILSNNGKQSYGIGDGGGWGFGG